MLHDNNSDRARLHFLGSEAVERRRLYPPHCEHQVQLTAVMRLVLGHRAEPLPECDRRPGGCNDLLCER